MRAVSLSDQGSNLDFLESKSSVLPVTPSDNFPAGYVPFGTANVLLEKFGARVGAKKIEENHGRDGQNAAERSLMPDFHAPSCCPRRAMWRELPQRRGWKSRASAVILRPENCITSS
jgi:hypothetical protein